jgi:hypothetical protein
MDLLLPIAQASQGITDTGITDAGKAIALGVGAGLGSIGAGIGIGIIFGKEIEVRGSFEPTIRSNGLAAVSTASLSVTPVGFESFSKMANDIAAQVTAEKYRSKLPCAPKDPKTHDEACARKIISHYGLLLFRRPLTEAELDNRVGLSRRMTEQTHDFYEGVRYSLSMLLQLPDFIFRSEVAIPSADGKSIRVRETGCVAWRVCSIRSDRHLRVRRAALYVSTERQSTRQHLPAVCLFHRERRQRSA